MRIAALLLAICTAFAGCASTKHSPTHALLPGEKSAFLNDVPHRIENFKRGYARDYPLTSEKFWLWDYANFLGELLLDVNQKIGDGTTLNEEHLRAIKTFAEVQTISSRGYVYPLWRGASGYDAAFAQGAIARYEETLRGMIAAMGHALNAFHESEKDWTEDEVKEWITRFDAAIRSNFLFEAAK